MTKDEKLARIARNLSEALQDYAYTRKDDDKKRVTALHAELVQTHKAEETV